MSTSEQLPLSRRAQHTRDLLQQAAMELVEEKSYDAISIQDITTRAQVGRTTFYLHFKSKDDLYLTTHVESVLKLGWNITLENLLAQEPPAYLLKFLESIVANRAIYADISRSIDAPIFVRHMREHAASVIEQCLRAHLAGHTSQISLALLSNYLAGAQISLVVWWIETRFAASVQEVAIAYQALQRAALQEALKLPTATTD